MSLLDDIEPDFWLSKFDVVPSSISNQQKRMKIGCHEDYTLPHYSREAVESLLSQCRKEALLEAADIADNGVVPGNHGNDVMTRHNIGNELRRMAESDKTTMEGEN